MVDRNECDTAAQAAKLMELALNDPVPAVEAAEVALTSEPSRRERVIALRARGLARRQLGGFDASAADLNAALDEADALADDNLWAEVGLTLAGTWVWQGHVAKARELLENCVARSTGAAHAESLYQLGSLHVQDRNFAKADAAYSQALPLIRELGKQVWEANLLGNRGTMELYRGNYDAALADLDVAIDLCRKHSSPSWTALYMNNKAYALQLRGDITDSLDLYAESEAFHDEHGLPKQMFAHRAQAYLAAGMYEETMALAQEAHRFHQQGNSAVGAIEALLSGGDAALALGDNELAVQLAQAAQDLDQSSEFPVWQAHAERIRIEARLRAGNTSTEDVRRAVELFEATSEAESVTAARAVLVGASVAIRHGSIDEAEQLLDRASVVVNQTPAHVQIERHTLLATIASKREEPEVVLREALEGLQCFDELVSGVASYDVRYKAGRHAESLAQMAIGPLIAVGDLPSAVAFIERVRAGALRLDDRMAPADQGELRPDESNVVWIERDDRVLCLHQTAQHLHVEHCGPTAFIKQLVDQHTFAYRQLARRQRLTNTARRALLQDAADADRRLATALLPTDLSDRVILSPAAILRPVVWGALPGFPDRPFVLAPSREIAHRRLPALSNSVAVAGASELTHVPVEVDAVAAIWKCASHLDPPSSSATELAAADLLHLAGHFHNETANPLLSSVALGEWSLRAADILRWQRVPSTIVVSACASGHGNDIAGADVGFASAALAAGCAAVIVTSTPIEDGATIVQAMTDLHALLRAGHLPAEALRELRTHATAVDRSVLSSLAVTGAGW